MRAVFDTNVIISATLWHNSVSQKLLIKLINANVEIFTSSDIILEYLRVLVRDFVYSEDEAISVLGNIMPVFTFVEPMERIDILKSDPEDNKILECAMESSADFIITYDKHLLELVEFRGVKIIKPEYALGFFNI